MTKEEKLQETLKKLFEEVKKEEVMAVYVSGSYLNNLMVETSDIDLFVVLKQNKYNLVMSQFHSGQNHGEYDYKYMESYKFVQMLVKTNPNMLELVFKYPVYVSESFKPLADFLYENRNEVVRVNLERYYSSSYHMLKNNYNKLKNGTGKVLRNQAGKESMNFYKTYHQVKGFSQGKDMQEFVELSGDLREFLLETKLKQSYTEQEKKQELKKMEECLEELKELSEKHVGVQMNFELVDEMVELL